MSEQTTVDPKIADILQTLEDDILKGKVDTDFGAFGMVARMNTNFHLLKEQFNHRRRNKITGKMKEALREIARDAVIAQTLI